ncbi:MAG: hypothetical protein MK188_14140 [Gammaproteobacteria bacterium]|nr:hypothetical protein [Gammaproteobacteria bacterium]
MSGLSGIVSNQAFNLDYMFDRETDMLANKGPAPVVITREPPRQPVRKIPSGPKPRSRNASRGHTKSRGR